MATFTDFGTQGPYLGQMEMAFRRLAPAVPVVHLLADAPVFDPMASAYLLAALAQDTPPGTVLLSVVDPGVGGDRIPMVVKVDGRWLVGPDNGLFEPLIRRAVSVEAWEIVWRPERLSATFHGRDLFAPVAARLALGQGPDAAGLRPMMVPRRPHWPDDLGRVIYFDHYGNAWTGLRAAMVEGEHMEVAGHRLRKARTFGELAPGEAFWYENSSGLVEIAVNGGRADRLSGIESGAFVTI
ncbi:SAM hydrolase/SAM-dependent halogenase family protein [Paramagnetospirillum kuznetsovii]|uniref:SAM hydrolase/SAM-dependent halogenase family protein n=1 Tax=Paramagnetospirillum kuznetsovii TaxID=2053833 RepID=UPI002AC35723|nr:SAM-dependent chlorinase/fluorinase [Paramagnetospirillum kuznetsovii]